MALCQVRRDVYICLISNDSVNNFRLCLLNIENDAIQCAPIKVSNRGHILIMSESRPRGDMMLQAYSPCGRLEMEIPLTYFHLYEDILGQKRNGNFILSASNLDSTKQLVEIDESGRLVREHNSNHVDRSVTTFMQKKWIVC